MGNHHCRSTGYDQQSGSSNGEKSRRRRLSGLYRRAKNHLGRHGQRDEAPPSSDLAKLTLDDLFGIACVEIRKVRKNVFYRVELSDGLSLGFLDFTPTFILEVAGGDGV